MNTITNNGARRIAVPCDPAMVLEPGQSGHVTDGQLADIEARPNSSRWIETGMLKVERNTVKPEPEAAAGNSEADDLGLPEGLTGEGVEFEKLAGGWFHVWVNGLKVTTSRVRKARAKEIAAEYDV